MKETVAGAHDERYFLDGLKRSDTKTFADLFDVYYADLVMFCGNYIKDIHQCEDIVSGIFLRLWEKREVIVIVGSLKSYLLNSVRNRALNEIRHKRVKDEHVRSLCRDDALESRDTDDYILYTDMRRLLDSAVDSMPEKIRESYLMYRECGMKSSEIAKRMNVTQRTIELRLCRALSILRKCVERVMLLVVL